MGTRLFAAASALILLIAVCLPLRAFALEIENPTQTAQTTQSYPEKASPTDAMILSGGEPPIEVYRASIDEEGTCYFLECGEAPGALVLPDEAYAWHAFNKAVPCEISWRFDQFDNLTPGRRMLVGDILLLGNYAFRDEPLTVQIAVVVYDPAAEPIVKIASCIYISTDEPNVIVPLGTSSGELPKYFENIEDIAYIVTEHGDTFFAPVTLNFNAIDTSKAGVYYPIELDLPECITFGGLEYFTLGVHVVPNDEVDLRAVSFYQSGYIVQWLHQAQNPILWVSTDDGEWSDIPPDEWGIHAYGRFVLNDGMAAGLELFSAKLTPGHVYRFQIQYDGDQFSDVLVLDLINENLPRATNESGGDRNGGDRGEDDPPIVPPVPTPPLVISPTPRPSPTPPTLSPSPQPSFIPSSPISRPLTPSAGTASYAAADISPSFEADGLGISTPEHESAPEATNSGAFNENPPGTGGEKNEASMPNLQVAGQLQAEALSGTPALTRNADGHSITITGEHLAAMAAANPQYVSFILEELRVSVPTEYILSLGITAQPFSVTLYQPNNLSFSVGFSLGGSPLADTFIGPFFVSIPWSGGPVSCRLASSSEESIEGVLDIASGKASFWLYKAGTYLLTEHAAAAIAQQDELRVPAQSEATLSVDTNAHTGSPVSSGTWRSSALISFTALMAAGVIIVFLMRRYNIEFGRNLLEKRVNAP